MFVQVKYQLRSRGRSVLVLCIAALLAACMAFYVGNIGVNKAALQSLSDSVPVTVRITSRNGAKTAGLNIETKPFDCIRNRDISWKTLQSSNTPNLSLKVVLLYNSFRGKIKRNRILFSILTLKSERNVKSLRFSPAGRVFVPVFA